MYVVYRTSVPQRLQRIRWAKPEEVKEYLDLCLQIGDSITRQDFRDFYSQQTNLNGRSTYRPKVIGEECCSVLENWLRTAGVELSVHDNRILDAVCRGEVPSAAEAEEVAEVWPDERHLPKREISIEDFLDMFQDRYLQQAHKIYVVHQILDAIHTYNRKMREIAECYDMLRWAGTNGSRPMANREQAIWKWVRYLDESGSHQLKGSKGGFSLDAVCEDLQRIRRFELGNRTYLDPLGLVALRRLVSSFYDIPLEEPHPVLSGTARGRSWLAPELERNKRIYQRLMLTNPRLGVLKPTEIELQFSQLQKKGYAEWQQTRFCQRVGEGALRRAVKLFDLMVRYAVYEFVVPNGVVGRTSLSPLNMFSCSSAAHEVQLETPLCLADDKLQKHYYNLGKQLEITTGGNVIVHSPEESKGRPQWWLERMQNELRRQGATEDLYYYLDRGGHWRIGSCQEESKSES